MLKPYNQTMETSSLPIFVYISSEVNYIYNIMKGYESKRSLKVWTPIDQIRRKSSHAPPSTSLTYLRPAQPKQ